MTAPLLALPAELRNRILELVLARQHEQNGYTSFSESIQQQPKLLHTCRQLRNELWPMYFSNPKLVVHMSTPEVQRFRCFIHKADERLVATLQRLSLTLPCSGYPEFSHLNRCLLAHNVLYDIERTDSGRFEAHEYHGWWILEAGELTFGEMMNRTDSLGYSTCRNWAVLPVRVDEWVGARFRKEGLLALVDGLCAHESVAARLRYAGGSKVKSE